MAKLKLGFSSEILNAVLKIEKNDSKARRRDTVKSMDNDDIQTLKLVKELESLEKKSEIEKVGKIYRK